VLADRVTLAIDVPTIGIGAGPGCDGQVLVLHDLLGMSRRPAPKFVRPYAELGEAMKAAVASYASDVRAGTFPSDAESYHGSAELREALAESGGDGAEV
jgi:3-methyl-2-oxobutanoate hydroxymethyltransferase